MEEPMSGPGDAGPVAAAIVLTGGDPPEPAVTALLPTAAVVVAADSGADHAAALGLTVDLLVGDLDSISPAGRRASAGAEVLGAEADKDATDLEMALTVAARMTGPDARTVLVGGRGGRLDHELTTLATLAGPLTVDRRAEAWLGSAHALVVRDRVEIRTRPGELVSLIPVHGAATGVDTDGLRWPLRDATLDAGTTWGMSNQALAVAVGVRVASGILLVVRPHALAPAADGPPVPPRRSTETGGSDRDSSPQPNQPIQERAR